MVKQTLQTTVAAELSVELQQAFRLFPHLEAAYHYWNDERLLRDFPMELTAEVEAGRVTPALYKDRQLAYAGEVMWWVAEEMLLTRAFFGPRKKLSFEDLGIGEGWILDIVRDALTLDFTYRVWDFTDIARETGRNKLEEMFMDPVEKSVSQSARDLIKSMIQFGVLQLLFHDDRRHHKIVQYALLLASRIIQDNPQDTDMIIRNIPLQALAGGRAIFCHVFKEFNEGIKHTNSKTTRFTEFESKLNASMPPGQSWKILRGKNFLVGQETYTLLTTGDPALIGHQYRPFGL